MPKYDELGVTFNKIQELVHDINHHASQKKDKKLSEMIGKLDGLLVELSGELSIEKVNDPTA